MPGLTSDELAELAADVAAADADPSNAMKRIEYYNQLQADGDNYGALAAGVISGATLSGYVAEYFLETQAVFIYGKTLTPSDVNKISLDLMDADWSVRNAMSGYAGVTQIAAYHDRVFASDGLGPDVWTATVPLTYLTDSVWSELVDGINGSQFAGQSDVFYHLTVDYNYARLGLGGFSSDQAKQLKTWLDTVSDGGTLYYTGVSISVALDTIKTGFVRLNHSLSEPFLPSQQDQSSFEPNPGGLSNYTDISKSGQSSFEYSTDISQSGVTKIDYIIKEKDTIIGVSELVDQSVAAPDVIVSTNRDVNILVGSPGVNVFTLTEKGAKNEASILVGSSGTNTFNIDFSAPSENSGSTIIWGGGGDSTYNFASINSLTSKNKYTVVELVMPDVTVEKLAELDTASLLSMYSARLKTIALADTGTYENLVVIINPNQADVINYGGKSLNLLQSQDPPGTVPYEYQTNFDGRQYYVGYDNAEIINGSKGGYDNFGNCSPGSLRRRFSGRGDERG